MSEWLDKTHVGDCRELLQNMATDGVRVQTCVTSPPYYGLRDYGTAVWEGGEDACDHLQKRGDCRSPVQLANQGSQNRQYHNVCPRCGARRIDRQIGLEQTPVDYVNELVGVFRRVRRLLAGDGTLWLNLGDCYASKGNPGRSNLQKLSERYRGGGAKQDSIDRPDRAVPAGLKAKDLLGIPWMVAFALRDDGWHLRAEVIWHKPNAMPESVRDRPTKAHEHVFLLTVAPRYYYDPEAIYEPSVDASVARAARGRSQSHKWVEGPGQQTIAMNPPVAGREKRVRDVGVGANARPRKAMANDLYGERVDSELQPASVYRNARSVWSIPTQGFRGPHFAAFPQNLVRRCILASSRPADIVLDPFAGSGTVMQVATDLGRRYVGCELRQAYVDLHEHRRTTIGMPL
jgi:DNA modification methylase